MSKALTWSTTAASNNSAPPDGFPENMFPSMVNNSAREVMASVAGFADMLGLPFINLGFTAAVASNDLTITLKTIAAGNPSSTDPVTIYFRNTTVTTGQRTAVDYSTTTSVVLPGGGSLGFANSETGDIYIWAVYDGTNKDIGVSRQESIFDESSLHSTTTIGTGSDSNSIIYTTTGRTNAAITLIGRITIQYGTAAWTNAPTNLTVWQPGLKKSFSMGAATVTTSGTSVDFTGIPSWATAIIYSLNGVSTSGTSLPVFQLGDAGGVETSGYLSTSARLQDAAAVGVETSTNGFVEGNGVASALRSGTVLFARMNPSTNTWTAFGVISRTDASRVSTISGSKSLSAPLDRIRLTTVGGADTFDAGEVNIWYA